jgi:putative transposase
MTLKAFSYRFYPTPEQENLLRRTMGCVRLVYNRALAVRTEAWYQEQKRVGCTETSSMLTAGQKTEELDFLNQVSIDNLYKLTTRLVRENQTIALENLAVKNMIKNPKLDLAIGDASWGELVRQLEYKCDWYGRTLIKIDRWFPSSKRCFECGYIVEKMPLNVRKWDCPNCVAHHDRDLNAAKNILAAFLALKVCGATVRPISSKSVKAGAKPRQGKKQKHKS